MSDVLIVEVEILPTGQLAVHPRDNLSGMFAFIYRAAAQIAWDPDRQSFVSPVPREWSHTDWFRHILSAVRSETGVRLFLSDSTVWINISPETRTAIQDVADAPAT
jgi:Integron Cassette Protein Hfx_Cass5